MSDRNVVLIGFMGTGKTSVGTALAESLGYAFVDTDTLIEKKAGKRVSRIFEEDGENTFRTLEAEVIQTLPERKRAVVSAGGGAPLRAENMTALKRTGVVICLDAAPEEIYQRVKNESHRPLLKGHTDLRDRIRTLLDTRRSAYAQADHIIDTTPLTVDEVVDRCIELLSRDTRCDV
jgi:shikimate kinase